MKSGTKSRGMYDRARKVIPAGVNSNFRYWGEEETLVHKNAQGAYIWDQDDNKYIDYRLAFGPVVLGHAYPDVVERVKSALDRGNAFAMTTEYEISVAEKVAQMTGVDMMRFANSGTEATMHAIRIARAYTGREKILKFEGHYHGFQDYTLWNTYPPLSGAGYRRSPLKIPQGSGIPHMIGNLVESIPYNDEELLEIRIRDNWQDLAAVIFEPIMGNTAAIMPQKGFIDKIRKLCDKYNIVMIMDEVKTGFRIAPGGAQEYFNVKADMVTYAKALGNGFPVAAIGGKREIMGEIGPGMIAQGGTYAGNIVSASAADATLDVIAGGALKKVEAHGKKLIDGISKVFNDRGVPFKILGPPAMFGVVLTDQDEVKEYRDWAVSDHARYEQVILKLFEKGVMPDKDAREPWFVSASHSDADADTTLNAFEDSVKEVFG
ncbi:MAG: guanitoxin biosynthesis PLP-dependent transaminase GntE [Spirochaetaceae bacterium]